MVGELGEGGRKREGDKRCRSYSCIGRTFSKGVEEEAEEGSNYSIRCSIDGRITQEPKDSCLKGRGLWKK